MMNMKQIRRLFLHNGLRKIIALLLAITLYLGIEKSIKTESTREIKNVPVKVKLPNDLTGSIDKVTTNITVKGEEGVVKSLKAADLAFQISVNHNDLVEGHNYDVTPDQSEIRPPEGVRVIKCNKISLHLHKIIIRQIPVNVKYSGKLDKDFTITGTDIIPGTITITGPENDINYRSSIDAAAVPLSPTLFDSFEYKTKVNAGTLKVEPEEIIVRTNIARKFEYRKFKDVPVGLLTSTKQNNWKTEFADNKNKVDIIVRGSASALSALKADKIKAYVDISKVNSSSTLTLPVECSSGVDNVVIKSVTPGEIPVKVTAIKK
jgi:YbbR domain-containing protein